MIDTFVTYIFHDTFTVLKVFSKQNERSLSFTEQLWIKIAVRAQGAFFKLWTKSHQLLPNKSDSHCPRGGFRFKPLWNLTFLSVCSSIWACAGQFERVQRNWSCAAQLRTCPAQLDLLTWLSVCSTMMLCSETKSVCSTTGCAAHAHLCCTRSLVLHTLKMPCTCSNCPAHAQLTCTR